MESGQRSSPLFSDGLLPVSSFSSSSFESPLIVCYIVHPVSKTDTLPGIAIKYGVEVADIKQLNGLMTDIQMYARKSLQIPHPGRHPPSVCLKSGPAAIGLQRILIPERSCVKSCSKVSTQTHLPSNDMVNFNDSLYIKTPPNKVSLPMSHIQSYYDLTPKHGLDSEGTAMVFHKTGSLCLDDELLSKESPFSDPLPGQHNFRHLVNGHPKIDTDKTKGTPVLLLEDKSSGLVGKRGKDLAMRPRLGSQTEINVLCKNSDRDLMMTDGFASVRKSSRASSLQESENSSSLWPTTKWNLKLDFLAGLIFDSLPMPMSVWKNKASVD